MQAALAQHTLTHSVIINKCMPTDHSQSSRCLPAEEQEEKEELKGLKRKRERKIPRVPTEFVWYVTLVAVVAAAQSSNYQAN